MPILQRIDKAPPEQLVATVHTPMLKTAALLQLWTQLNLTQLNLTHNVV